MEFYNCDVSEEGKKNVMEVLNSGYLNQGKYVAELESTILPKYMGNHHPILTNSCTSALHIALELSYVRGREVILPGKTFIATGMAVLMAGGIPVFCDVEDDFQISLETVAPNISKNTAAVIGVSWGGKTCALQLCRIRNEFPHINTIEDAAHAFGTKSDSNHFTDYRCYSFQAIKALSCGDGGAIACLGHFDSTKAKAMRWFGINKDKMTFDNSGKRVMEVERPGYKYNMNDFNAALLTGNLTQFQNNKTGRFNVCKIYNDALGLQYVSEDYNENSFWLYGLLVRNSKDWIRVANELGIPARKMDSDVSIHHVFGKQNELKKTQFIDEHEIYFPCHDKLTFNDVTKITNLLKRIKISGNIIDVC